MVAWCPRIIDFGISLASWSHTSKITVDGDILGTPAYMSPEQALGRGAVTSRADVWSIGVVLFEMLVGRQPFEATNHHAMLRSIIEDDAAAIPPSVDPRVSAVISRCLEKDPDLRYPSGAAVGAALEAALEDIARSTVRSAADATETTTTPARSTPEPNEAAVAPAIAREPRRRLVAFALLACALAGAGASRVRSEKPSVARAWSQHLPDEWNAGSATPNAPKATDGPAAVTPDAPPTDQTAKPSAPKPRPQPLTRVTAPGF